MTTKLHTKRCQVKEEAEWTGGQREDGSCHRKSAGSGGVVMACYWRTEKGRGGEEREQPLASASERTGVTSRKVYKPI